MIDIEIKVGMMIVAVMASATLGAATTAALAVWFQGELFDGARAGAEAYRDSPDEGFWPSTGRFFGKLLTCPFCLSYHVSAWLVVLAVCVGLLPWEVSPFVWLAAQFFGYQLYVYFVKELL